MRVGGEKEKFFCGIEEWGRGCAFDVAVLMWVAVMHDGCFNAAEWTTEGGKHGMQVMSAIRRVRLLRRRLVNW